MREKKAKINRTKNFFLITLLIFFIITFSFSLYKIINWKLDNDKTNETIKKIETDTQIQIIDDNENTQIVNAPENEEDPYWDFIKVPLISVDFNSLKKQNSDTVGWIYVEGTNINYPVVQTKNNKYYLNVSFDDTYNDGGWIFMDYRNNSTTLNQNTIIYGHSRYNKTMFGTLRNVLTNSWYKDQNNHIIKFSTPTENTLWQVFSTYKIEEESYYITPSFDTDYDYQIWLDTMLKRSIFNYKTDVNASDKVLTLSSCYNTSGTRMVLHAKLIKVEKR